MVEENFEIRLSEMHEIGSYSFTMVEENFEIRLSEMHQIGLI